MKQIVIVRSMAPALRNSYAVVTMGGSRPFTHIEILYVRDRTGVEITEMC